MKKLLGLLIVSFVLFGIMAVSAREIPCVADYDELLSVTEERQLEEKISEISQEYSFDIVILTFDDLDGKDIETYTADYFMDNGYGYGSERDGLILSIYSGRDEDIRKFCSLGHGSGEDATGVYFYNCLYDESSVVDSLSDDEFYAAFSEYLDLAREFLAAYEDGDAYNPHTNRYRRPGVLNTGFSVGELFVGALIVLAVSAVVAFIYLYILKSKMNTARRAANAAGYVENGSFVLRRQKDFFVFSNVSRVRIKSDTNSHGGGSFRSSGGSSFKGGSGRF